jgi:hypothetical protein
VEVEAYEKLLANELPASLCLLGGESTQRFAGAKKPRLKAALDCLAVEVPASRKLGWQDNMIEDRLEKRRHC